jgi:hypothetical protein
MSYILMIPTYMSSYALLEGRTGRAADTNFAVKA